MGDSDPDAPFNRPDICNICEKPYKLNELWIDDDGLICSECLRKREEGEE